MNNGKRQIALNTHLLLPIVIFAFFVILSISCINEGSVGMAIGFGVATLLPLFVFAISPMYYVFSEDSVEIIYLWGQKEEIKWDVVRSITQNGSWISRYSAPPYYNFAYPVDKKRLFFMRGDVSKTRKTKKLIKKYYKKDIV